MKNENNFSICGMFSFVLIVALCTSLITQEILYWTNRNDEPDGWEDDLTNQA
jgi:hypothetical protein